MPNQEREQYNRIFQQELEKLNPAQRLAVETIYGQVMVIAGPGTGKTQILAARIGNILTKTDIYPHNILCLTFTDAGAVAMRERLLRFIGPDAYKVNISTFHSFCNTVIQENRDYFGISELQAITELEQALLFRQLIDSFPPNHVLRRLTGDIYFERDRLKSLFADMKKENWSPDLIQIRVKEYLDDLPNRDGFVYKRATKDKKAGDLNEKKIKEETDKMEKLLAATQEFDRFQNLMAEKERYDFQDMIQWVVKAFSVNDDMLLRYQERYQFVLVDEFQDTSGAQNEILNLLTSYDNDPNIFAVGDDDQSIYGFQGAKVKKMNDFVNKYKDVNLKMIVLTENYRSTQAILDSAGQLIAHNKERLLSMNPELGLQKELKASLPEIAQEKALVEVMEFANTVTEEAFIVDQIQELNKNGMPFSEMAVIYRNHKDVSNIINVLERRKIPYSVRQKINVLDEHFIQSLLKIFKYIATESRTPDSGDYLLFEIMHFEWFQIPPRDIQFIARSIEWGENRRPKPWRSVTSNPLKMLELGLVAAEKVSQLDALLTQWAKERYNQTLQVWFEKVLVSGGILEYVLHSEQKVWLLQALNTFFDFLKAESAKNPHISIEYFLDIVDEMYTNRIRLAVEKIFERENGVNLLTAHGSKGLEYDHVFITKANRENWEKKRSPNSGYSIPDTLLPQVEFESEEEERRLFYVAVTRARKKLQICYAKEDKNGKEIQASQFVAEIEENPSVIRIQPKVLEDTVFQFVAETMVTQWPDPVQLEQSFITQSLKNYRLNVTHLNKYLKCPLTFYFEHIVRVPTAKNAAIGFGNAIHHALDKFFKSMQQQRNQFPDKETFMKLFREGMAQNASNFTEKEYQLRMEYAHEALPMFYDQYINSWNKIVKTEYHINHVEMDGVPLKGVLDKLEFTFSDVNVVDYKTGKPENAKEKLKRPDEKNPQGGDYWRQIVFYKILMDLDYTHTWTMISGEIDFVQKPDKEDLYKKERFYPLPEDISIVKGQIKFAYEKILAHDFSKGCQEEECTWCNFVKNNYRTVPEEVED